MQGLVDHQKVLPFVQVRSSPICIPHLLVGQHIRATIAKSTPEIQVGMKCLSLEIDILDGIENRVPLVFFSEVREDQTIGKATQRRLEMDR